jgi:hypothetical protein
LWPTINEGAAEGAVKACNLGKLLSAGFLYLFSGALSFCGPSGQSRIHSFAFMVGVNIGYSIPIVVLRADL